MMQTFFQIKTHQNYYHTTMSASLYTLPVEIVFQIFDHLSDKSLFISATNICQRLNSIQMSYHRFRVSAQYYSFGSLRPDTPLSRITYFLSIHSYQQLTPRKSFLQMTRISH